MTTFKISDEKLQEFKVLWKKHCNEELTDEEANFEAQKLLNFMKLIMTPPESKKS